MNALGRLEASNGATLDKLKSGEVDAQALLVQLLTTSCLLEVSKLLSARVDVGTFAPAALEVLTQFAPVDSCAIRIEAPDVPSTRAVMGAFPDDLEPQLFESVLAGAHREAGVLRVGTLVAGDHPVGYLAAENLAEAIVNAELIEKVAQQISTGLDTLIEAERTRRKLAAAKASEIVSRLDEAYSAEDLGEFVRAIAALQNAAGARLVLQNPRLGGPVTLQAGAPGDAPMTRLTHEVDRRILLSVEVVWGSAPEAHEEEAVAKIVESLATAIGRIERTMRLADEVETDELTGVGNRRRALRMLSAARSWAEREDRCFSVLIFDLDHFKKVNDTLGHHIGDKVLAGFAAMVQGSIREYDTVARWGGEEFLVICPDTDMYQADALAQRLLAAVPGSVAEHVPEGWDQTASIGIASYPMHGENPTAVVNAADTALYASKNAGRNRSTVAPLAANARIVAGKSR
jgi:diguanylate cyclase (GGDEF)-like protein